MKNAGCLLVALTLFFASGVAQVQTIKKALGHKPGLGSGAFVIADTIFHFSSDLNVQGKIYYKEYAKRYKTKQTKEEKSFPIKNIYFACDTFILPMFRLDTAIKSGGISAIKISSDNLWHTIYGETQTFSAPIEIKELEGTGIKDGFYYIYVCPTEQPCFSMRVKVGKEKKFMAEFEDLYFLWEKVGTGFYN